MNHTYKVTKELVLSKKHISFLVYCHPHPTPPLSKTQTILKPNSLVVFLCLIAEVPSYAYKSFYISEGAS